MTKSTTEVGRQFMEIMQDYMECQERPSFNVQQGLQDLYEDLSNLYDDNKTTQ